MVIKSLKLKNYRNYDLLDLKFDPKTNILYGDNAQGKTNILEALYLSGTTKSHRGTKDRDVIQFGYDESLISCICNILFNRQHFILWIYMYIIIKCLTVCLRHRNINIKCFSYHRIIFLIRKNRITSIG